MKRRNLFLKNLEKNVTKENHSLREILNKIFSHKYLGKQLLYVAANATNGIGFFPIFIMGHLCFHLE